MLGVALANVRLSFDDFCRLTPDEFSAIYKEYQAAQEARYKDEWERMRLLATIAIQPHVKNKLTPQKVLPFSWDEGGKKKQKPAEVLTAEEHRKRFEEFMKMRREYGERDKI